MILRTQFQMDGFKLLLLNKDILIPGMLKPVLGFDFGPSDLQNFSLKSVCQGDVQYQGII